MRLKNFLGPPQALMIIESTESRTVREHALVRSRCPCMPCPWRTLAKVCRLQPPAPDVPSAGTMAPRSGDSWIRRKCLWRHGWSLKRQNHPHQGNLLSPQLLGALALEMSGSYGNGDITLVRCLGSASQGARHVWRTRERIPSQSNK